MKTTPTSIHQASRPIETRLRFGVLPALLIVIILAVSISLYRSIDLIKQNNFALATANARNIFDMTVLIRQWNADLGGIYVFKSPKNPPNPYLTHPERDLVLADLRELTMLNPAYMTRQIAELAEKDSRLNLRIHLTSDKPIRPENVADAWESVALVEFAAGSREKTSVELMEGQPYLRYMAPLFVQQACLRCHAKQGYQVGDIRGGLSVSLRYQPVQETIDQQIQATFILHGIFTAILISISWGLIELLARRWRALNESIVALGSARDELIENEKMASLGRLVAGFSHELNTPVGIAVGAITYSDEQLRGLTELLKKDEVSEDELGLIISDLREGHQLALANIHRAADLVQRFKRTSIDLSSSQKRQYQLAELIQDVLATLRNALKNRPIKIDVNCPEHIHLYGTPGLLEQILTNLITNSLVHGYGKDKPSGIISINASKSVEGQVTIIYQDDGQGMTDAVRQQAFEPFFSTAREQGGSGLGLFVVYNIVSRQLNGTIHLTSHQQSGTRFEIEFPDETIPGFNSDINKDAP